MDSGATQPHTHVPVLPQTPLPSRLPRSPEQSSPCRAVGPCDDPFGIQQCVRVHPNSRTPPSRPSLLATLSLLSALLSLVRPYLFFLDSACRGWPTAVLPGLSDCALYGSLRGHPRCCRWHHFVLTRVWLNPFAVHLELTALLTGSTPLQSKKSAKNKILRPL